MTSPTQSINIKNIEFQGYHGYTQTERQTLRLFRVHVQLFFSLDKVVKSDALEDTVDYRKICNAVVDVGIGTTVRLIETLAGKICDTIQTMYPHVAFSVEVEKINPPCRGNPTTSSAILYREAI